MRRNELLAPSFRSAHTKALHSKFVLRPETAEVSQVKVYEARLVRGNKEDNTYECFSPASTFKMFNVVRCLAVRQK